MWLVNKWMFYSIFLQHMPVWFFRMYALYIHMWFGVYWKCDCVVVTGQNSQIERKDCSIWKQSIRMILSVDLSKRSYHLHCNGESFPKLHVVVSSNLGNITSMSLSLKPNDYNLDKSIRQIDYILLVGYLATLSCWATISLCWLPVRTQEVSLKFSTTWRRFSSTVVQWPIGPCGTTGWCQQFSQPFKHLTGSEMCERLRGS